MTWGGFTSALAVPAASSYQRGIHAPHLCGPYRHAVEHPATQSGCTSGGNVVDGLFRVYCDLDGVLADFNHACIHLFPEGGPIADKIPTHTVTKLTYEEETEMWRRVEAKPDFFASLPWMPDGEELWIFLDWNCVPPPAVLTGLPVGRAGQMASKQKEQWCREKLGEHITVFCCGTRNKQKFSGPRCILVDDRGDLREAWEARGGIFIHHTSAAESIRQLREVFRYFRGQPGQNNFDEFTQRGAAVQLTSICWAAQTPAGCFRPNCRYLHLPISRRHRSWIQVWGFLMWSRRMFDDVDQLVQCVRAVYAAHEGEGSFHQLCEDMDEQSQGAFSAVLETLRESCDLGMPFEFLQPGRDRALHTPLPPIAPHVRAALAVVRRAMEAAEALDSGCRAVVAGSVGLGVDVDGSDLDIVLCCPIEIEPLAALRALLDAMSADAEAEEPTLIEEAATPLLTFRFRGLSIDVAVNQMGSIRDVLLFRYALRSESPALADLLRLLKLWLKRRKLPGTKQGGFPTSVWMRMAVRFYQERKCSAAWPACDLLRGFLNWASQGLPAGGAPLTIHGEQSHYNSAQLAAGIPAASMLLILLEMSSFLESDPRTDPNEVLAAKPHAGLCRVGRWHDRLAIFYVQGQGLQAEALLCRVGGVLGGPKTQLRCCDCQCCTDAHDPVTYVSRRSTDWLIIAHRLNPQRLRIQAALQGAGIQKKRTSQVGSAGVHEELSDAPLLFQPRHLVAPMEAHADPLRQLAQVQKLISRIAWLPPAEPESRRISRALLLAGRSHAQEAAMHLKAMALDDVYARVPQRRQLEDARAGEQARLRLHKARSLRALSRALQAEHPYAAGTEEMQKAHARLAALQAGAPQQAIAEDTECASEGTGSDSESSLSTDNADGHTNCTCVPSEINVPSYGGLAGCGEERGDVRQQRMPSTHGCAERNPDASLVHHGAGAAHGFAPEFTFELRSVQIELERTNPRSILGFACEAATSHDGTACLRIVSISEMGLLAHHNRDAAIGMRVGEGSLITAVNGASGDDAQLRKALEFEGPLQLTVLLDSSLHLDDCGRKIFAPSSSNRKLGPSHKVAGASLLLQCRCIAGGADRCKCGLADALGKAGEDVRGWRNPEAALRVGNLRSDVDEETLYDFFCGVSPVETVRIIRNTTTLESECHGFVNFRTFTDAQQALTLLDGRKIWGRRCHLSWSSHAKGLDGNVPARPLTSSVDAGSLRGHWCTSTVKVSQGEMRPHGLPLKSAAHDVELEAPWLAAEPASGGASQDVETRHRTEWWGRWHGTWHSSLRSPSDGGHEAWRWRGDGGGHGASAANNHEAWPAAEALGRGARGPQAARAGASHGGHDVAEAGRSQVARGSGGRGRGRGRGRSF